MYSSALQEAQKKLNYIPLVELVCNAILESDLEIKKSKEAIEKLPMMWQERAGFREGSAGKRAFDVLLHKPILSSLILQRELGISKTASTNAIKSLVEKKIIRHRKFENRMPVYAAEELIQILSRPFGSDIDLALEKGLRLLNE